MRLLHRRRPGPRAKTARPAERYLAAGAGEARRLGHDYVGTEHVLLVLIHNPEGGGTAVLRQLGVGADAVEDGLARWFGPTSEPKIDPNALAVLGIDFEVVRERLEETFGPGALERTPACLGVCPRLKKALAYAVDHADGEPVADEHILLGMLSVPDSVAARVLAQLGVSLAAAQAVLAGSRE
jgi:ATP-dependent Clp protease ATP-binding subunit ClpA